MSTKVKDAPYMKIYQFTSRSSIDPKNLVILQNLTYLLSNLYIFAIRKLFNLKKILKKLICEI